MRTLPENADFRDVLQKRAADARDQIRKLREQRQSPAEKSLDQAGLHVRLVHRAKTKLQKKQKAHERLEAEFSGLSAELEELEKKVKSKKKDVEEAEKAAHEAQDELDALMAADKGAANGKGEGGGAGKGTNLFATVLGQVEPHLPAELKVHWGQLRQILGTMLEAHKANEAKAAQATAAADAAGTAAAAAAVTAAPEAGHGTTGSQPPPRSTSPRSSRRRHPGGLRR